jgi:hypothetical protein
MCTGDDVCKPYAECWPDQDKTWYGKNDEKNETYSDFAYWSYSVLSGAQCENAEVHSLSYYIQM